MNKTLLPTFKNFTFFSILCLVSLCFQANAATIWTENFTSSTGYSVTLGGEGNDGSSDYFQRTDGTTPGIGISYSGNTGNFFAAQDVDDGGWTGSANPSQLTWTGIDITGYTSLQFNGKFASSTTNKIDDNDYVLVEYKIGAGSWTNLIAFENDGTQYNTQFGEDTDFNGDSDGADLTSTLTNFNKSIPGTGTSLDLRITVAVNAGGEDFAFEDFEITGNGSTPTINVSTNSLTGFTYVVGSGPSAEQSFTIDGSNLTADIVLTAPTDYEISTTSGSGFGSSVTLTQSGGTVSSTTIYVRLTAGRSVGAYNGQDIACTSTGATTQNVTCNGDVTPNISNESNIINSDGATPDISYINYLATTINTVSDGVSIWDFTLQDGGNDLTDADNLPTILDGLTLSSIGNIDFIETAALFAGSTLLDNNPTINTGAQTISFSNISSAGQAGDNGSLVITLYVTFKTTTIVDNQYLGVTIVDADVIVPTDGTSSEMASFGSVNYSPILGNPENRVVVIATELEFGQQPSDVGNGVAMSPDVTVRGVDTYGILDLDFTDNVDISSSGTMTGDPITVAASAGVATFSGLTHTVDGTGLTLTASHATFANEISTTFDVTTGPWEDFEVGSKGSYAAGNVTCTAGNWNFNDALIGTAANDRKNGSQSARVRNSGSLTMNFDVTTGLGTVDILHARYGSDGNSTWRLEASTDGGSTWTAYTSPTVTTGSSTLTNQSFTLNIGGTVRFRIVKLSGGSNRINFDDISITPYTAIPEPEIEVHGNGVEIANGDNTPTVTDSTDFESTTLLTPIFRNFVVYNTGTDSLDFTGSVGQHVVLSNTTDFSVTIQPTINPLPFSGTNYTTFQIQFNPATIGSKTSTVTIYNNDSDESPFTFTIEGEGTYDNTSTITENGTSYNAGSPGTKIEYINYQATPGVGNAVSGTIQVMRVRITDGGDGDGRPTILQGIEFSVKDLSNVDQDNQLRHAVLATSTNSIKAVGTISGGKIVFSGLPAADFTTSDGSILDYILRVSYKSDNNIVDNTKFVFKVISATADATNGSVFFSADAGGATSDNSGDNRNRINVSATELLFGQQPSDVTTGSSMNPSVTVRGVDVNGILDVDFADNVSISSTGSLTGDPVTVTAIGGVATFSSLVHSAVGTGLTLTASHTTFSNETSNTFNVTTITYVNGDYRTTGSGNWLSNQASPAIWERLSGGSWVTSNSPSYNTSNNVYIRDGHSITSGGSFGNGINVKIMGGGTFTVNHSSTTNSIYMYDGATLYVSAALQNNNSFEVEDNATVYIDHQYGNGSQTIPALWDGTEIFHPNSNLILTDYDCADDFLIPDDISISTNTFNGYTAVFGNITIDFGASSNLSASDELTMLDAGVTINMAHGDLLFLSHDPDVDRTRIAKTGTITSGIGGDFIVDNLYDFDGYIEFKTSGTLTFTVEGNMELNSATTRVFAGSSGSGTTLNIEGDLDITPSAVMDFNPTITSNAIVNVINLKGDLTVASSGLFQNTNGNYDHSGIINFVAPGDGLTDSTTQTIEIASTSSNENRHVDFHVTDGSYVRLIERDLELGQSGKFTVETGGTFDFGFDASNNALDIAVSGSQTAMEFESESGSILKITSPDGLYENWNTSTYPSVTQTTGNLTISKSNRNINTLATFWYIGKQDQHTGDCIGASTNARIVIVDLINNNTTLTPDLSFGFTSTQTLSLTGGKLDIRKGKFIETETEYVTGSGGTLYMESGTWYKIVKGYSAADTAYGDFSNFDKIPRMTGGTYPYILNGGTIELGGNSAGNHFQVLRADDLAYDYHNIVYSGSNTLGVDYKALSNETTITDSLYITGSAIVDCHSSSGSPRSFVGPGGLIMDGDAHLRILKLNTPNPELEGQNEDYNLSGNSTIEFYGTSAIEQQSIRGRYNDCGAPCGTYKLVEYNNLEINADAANYSAPPTVVDIAEAGNVDLNESFTLKGTMNVNSPAVLRMDAVDFIYKFNDNATNNVNILDGAGLLYGSPYGITTVATGGTGLDPKFSGMANPPAGNVRTSIRTFSSDASYGFIAPGDMVSGDALPAVVDDLYVYKTAVDGAVTLTNSVTSRNLLKMYQGHIITDGNLLELGTGTSVLGTLDYGAVSPDEPGFVIGEMKRWFGNVTNSGNASGLFPMGDTVGQSPIDYRNRHALIEFTSAPVAGSLINSYDGETAMGLSGIPFASQIAANGGCLAFDVSTTEDEGFWNIDAADGLAGGTYTSTLTGEDYFEVTNLCELTLLKRDNAGSAWEGPTLGGHIASSSITGSTLSLPKVRRTGLSGFSDFGFGGGDDNPLPVELLEFIAYKKLRTSQLDWITASEINNEKFIVEHSLNGVDFYAIGEVAGAGTSTTEHFYEFVHEQPVNGKNYYRLTQVDYDGASSQSPIRVVEHDDAFPFSVQLMGNPILNGELEVSISSSKRMETALAIFATDGKLIKLKIIDLEKGTSMHRLNMEEFAKGVYFLSVTNDEMNQGIKILKSR